MVEVEVGRPVIKIFVPFTNERIFSSSARRRDPYRLEFRKWLLETFGQVSGGYWGVERKFDGIVFKFKESEHAMVFKLMWAGS